MRSLLPGYLQKTLRRKKIEKNKTISVKKPKVNWGAEPDGIL